MDFEDPERIFIGRALTEARAKTGKHLRMQLVAFDVAFDPSLLVEVPMIEVEDNLYPMTSIARVPEGPYTVGLVRLRKMGLVMVSISTPWMRASSAAAQKPAQSRPDQL